MAVFARTPKQKTAPMLFVCFFLLWGGLTFASSSLIFFWRGVRLRETVDGCEIQFAHETMLESITLVGMYRGIESFPGRWCRISSTTVGFPSGFPVSKLGFGTRSKAPWKQNPKNGYSQQTQPQSVCRGDTSAWIGGSAGRRVACHPSTKARRSNP